MRISFTKKGKRIITTKQLASLMLALVMCLSLCVPVFAVAPEEITDQMSGNVSAATAVPKPRLSKTTVSKALNTTTWVKLYSDDNWTDVEALITNNAGNPGSIAVKIEADSGGQTVSVGSKTIAVDTTWTSPTIASSYGEYTVYAKASSMKGTYSITYDDN